jgi:NAD(P)-dependent dehydrogenase (short-subunit alcohol dehydrogenase family)
MTDFQGLVAVVTGGASGIGAATARLLQARGANVAIFDRNTDSAPDGVLALRCEVTHTAGRRPGSHDGRGPAGCPRHPGEQRWHRGGR